MTQRQFAMLLACVCLIPAGGCASKEAVIKSEPAAATISAAPPVIAPRGKLTNAIAAIVNDEVVTLHDINKEAETLIREAEKQTPLNDAARSRIRRTTLDQLIDKKLVDQKIKELNIKVSEEELRQTIEDVKKQNNIPSQEAFLAALANQGLSFDQYRTQLQEQIEKLKLVSMEVRAKIQVTETEMREFYEANRTKFTEDESYRARHIFFKINEKGEAEEVKRTMTKALMVLAETRSGKDFTDLAKTYSEDPSASKDGGDLGTFKKDDMQPELKAAIIALQPGEVSELVYTPAGFHIIKLEERISGKLKPFESVRAEIDEALYKSKSEVRFSQWVADLRSKASIEIKELKGML